MAAFGGLQLVYGPWSDRIGRRPLLLGAYAWLLREPAFVSYVLIMAMLTSTF